MIVFFFYFSVSFLSEAKIKQKVNWFFHRGVLICIKNGTKYVALFTISCLELPISFSWFSLPTTKIFSIPQMVWWTVVVGFDSESNNLECSVPSRKKSALLKNKQNSTNCSIIDDIWRKNAKIEGFEQNHSGNAYPRWSGERG